MDSTRASGDRSQAGVLIMEMDSEVELEVQIPEGREEVLNKLPSLLLEMEEGSLGEDSTMEEDTTQDSTMEAKDSTRDTTMEVTAVATMIPTVRVDRSVAIHTMVRHVSIHPFLDRL